MLFPYKYINHDMEKMQKFMDYIFFEVWMKAKFHDDFSLSLFDKNNELKEIIFYFFYKDDSPKYGKEFVESVMKIFKIFKKLNSYHLKLLRKWYLSNNNIKEICRGNKKPIRYKDISFNKELKDLFYELYSNLYEQNYLGLKNKDEHYKSFFETNKIKYCPFCGLSKMKGNLNTKKEAYDHYFPQEKYPFNTINFYNLVPTCNTCNSSYKLRKDPLYLNDTTKRKVYYPYSNKDISISISIEIKGKTLNLDIKTSEMESEELETWKEVYSIEERYKAFCDFTDEGGSWIEDARIYIEEGKGTFDDFISYVEKLLDKHSNPYHESRFLKVPFLKACQSAGINV